FNVDGTNHNYELDDPTGYCRLITRDPVTAVLQTVNAQYANIGALCVVGVDTAITWNPTLSDLGLSSIPGSLQMNVSAAILMDQSQPATVGGVLVNYAGFAGASKLRTNTTLGYYSGSARVALNWLYRKGTGGLLATNLPSPTINGYPADSLFNLTGGWKFGMVDVSASISNLFNKKPDVGGWFVADQTGGFGTYDPYGDLVGRRYAVSMTMSF